MNDTTKNGGPAFPFACQGPTTAPETYYGMDLRDYFAAKAMQGFVSSYECGCITSPFLDIAEDAYDMADAMLKARGQR